MAPVHRGPADHHRVGEPGLHLGLGEALGVGTKVEEAERILGMQLRRLLAKEPGSVSDAMRARARIGKW